MRGGGLEAVVRILQDFLGPWKIGTKLKLTLPNRLRFMAVSSRRLSSCLSRSGVRAMRVKISERGRTLTLLLRPNGGDFTVVEELFLKRSYDVPTEGVKTILDLGGNIGLATMLL
jgi:hypothetical protein